jgi:glycosyltransferase involved in cell wall biosynthesis
VSAAEIDLIVCTKDRPADLARLIPSIAAQQGVNFRCILVDQSTDRRANERLIAGIGLVEYVHHTATGKSKALNLALRHSTAPLLAFTDDDCVLPTRWLADATRALSSSDLLFGNVIAPHHEEDEYFVPTIEFERDRQLRLNPLRYPTLVGMGANMAVRRDVIERCGGFDETLGPGAQFRAGEDCEFIYRALAAGFSARQMPDWSLVHHGFRRKDTDASTRLIADSFFGIGVGLGKHVRTGDVRSAIVCVSLSARNVGEIVRRLLGRHEHLHARRLICFWQGVVAGFRSGLDVPRITG